MDKYLEGRNHKYMTYQQAAIHYGLPYVINNCGNGWNVGRQTANGLLSKCTRVSATDAKPGDLIFFQGTYDVQGASHVGIYVGDGMMLHCGNPIQ